MSGNPGAKGWRQGGFLVALLETMVLGGLGLVVILWVIPTQTSGNALGLDPAYMPTLYAAVVFGLVVFNGVLHMAGLARSNTPIPGSLRLVAPIMVISGLGIAAFHFLGAVACGIAILPAMMLALGERRWFLIVGTTAIGAVILAIVFR